MNDEGLKSGLDIDQQRGKGKAYLTERTKHTGIKKDKKDIGRLVRR